MPWFDIIWTDEVEEHIAQHDLNLDDVRYVLENFESETVSRSSGRPIRFAMIPDGRQVAVVFEYVDDITLEPVTAYPLED